MNCTLIFASASAFNKTAEVVVGLDAPAKLMQNKFENRTIPPILIFDKAI
jgi:hypothetical protein